MVGKFTREIATHPQFAHMHSERDGTTKLCSSRPVSSRDTTVRRAGSRTSAQLSIKSAGRGAIEIEQQPGGSEPIAPVLTRCPGSPVRGSLCQLVESSGQDNRCRYCVRFESESEEGGRCRRCADRCPNHHQNAGWAPISQNPEAAVQQIVRTVEQRHSLRDPLTSPVNHNCPRQPLHGSSHHARPTSIQTIFSVI